MLLKSFPSILHICNDYLGSKVHSDLYKWLGKLGSKQTVFVPIRKSTADKLDEVRRVSLNYDLLTSSLMRKHHGFFFELKRKFLFRNLIGRVNPGTIDIVHATTLFSDGALAYDIFRKYNIPYIVTVRNTDVSVFLKYRPDLTGLAKDILFNAAHVVFVSHAIKGKLTRNKRFSDLVCALDRKCSVIPNGINEYWLSNIRSKKEELPTKLIYVGTLIPRKNVPMLVKAVLALKGKFPSLSLTIVGGKGKDEKIIRNLASKHPNSITYCGLVKDRDELLKLYGKHHIFVMPSYGETFGLVYIEALTQGLPILYSENDGVDGFIANSLGLSVNPYDFSDIKKGVEEMIVSYSKYDMAMFEAAEFDWQYISRKYFELYKIYAKPGSYIPNS